MQTKRVVNETSLTVRPNGAVEHSASRSTELVESTSPLQSAKATVPRSLLDRLEAAGQTHVFKFYSELSPEERSNLEADVGSVDVDALMRWYTAATDENQRMSSPQNAEKLQPIPQEAIVTNLSLTPTPEVLSFRTEGLKMVGEGKVAALLMAGGQGTRLGSKDPKGMFPLGLSVDPTLFQLQAHRLRRLAELGSQVSGKPCAVPWYIMTSGATKPGTVAFLKAHDYFGLDPSNVFIFEQCVIPCLTDDGKMILKTKSSLARAPDGNGGLYRALRNFGVLEDMDKRGIEFTHVYGVDNALVHIADPIFVGAVARSGADVGNKSCLKKEPSEKVGVICIKNGKYQVVEYSEMDAATCELRRDDGELLFSSGNVCNHLFTTEFLRRACAEEESACVHHIARKKIPYVDTSGNLIEPTEPNGMKLEKFVFDVFVLSKKLTVLEICRENEFSPLKNASAAGKDCVDTVRKMVYDRNRRYLANAGAKFVDAAGTELDLSTLTEEHVCEISPLVSYAGEGLEKIVKEQSPFSFPIYIRK